jgi:hypothetical protein
VNAVNGLSGFFGSLKFHFDMNAADDEYAIFRFDFAPHVCREAPVTCIDLARFQRAPEGSDHSPTGGRNDIIDRRGMGCRQLVRIDSVVFGNRSMDTELHRLRFTREVCDS